MIFFLPFLAFIQQIGRAGRDQATASSTIFYNNNDIGTNIKHLRPEMKEYCLATTCRRNLICKHFGFQNDAHFEYGHQCCDNCQKDCKCHECVDSFPSNLEEIEKEISENEEMDNILYNYLHEEVLAGANISNAWDLAKKISSHAHLYTDSQVIVHDLDLDVHFAQNIMSILSVFSK